MSASGSKSLPNIGFLTVCEDGDGSFCGGYLVLNAAGRPLEFHCTSPVKPNRAQEILYGPTLRPYLFGEQIGQTLVTRSKAGPVLLVTDQHAALAVRGAVDVPAVCLLGTEERDASLLLGKIPVVVDRAHPQDVAAARACWTQHFEGFDLEEPFGRIREALDESRKAA